MKILNWYQSLNPHWRGVTLIAAGWLFGMITGGIALYTGYNKLVATFILIGTVPGIAGTYIAAKYWFSGQVFKGEMEKNQKAKQPWES